MAEYSNERQSVYSDLEPQNVYSQPEVDGGHSDSGSISGGSDHGSLGHRNGSDGHHDDAVHRAHHDRDGDHSDREDDLSDRDDRRSDRKDLGSDRDDQSDREDGRSDRGGGRRDSHSIHDREGSLHDSNDGSRGRHDDQTGDLYDALDDLNDLVEQAEAEQNSYSNVDQDRKSDGSQSDDEGEGHVRAARRESVEGVRATVGDEESIYDELQEHQSDSDGGSERGGLARGHHGGHSDDLYDDVMVGHARENGHQRRKSHDSDEENHRSSVDGGFKKSTGPVSSGKFMLRTSRKADALHVLRHIRDSSSADDNPEMDELVTVLRSSADHRSKDEDNLEEEERQKERIKSFITSKLIHKFEQGIASEDPFNENDEDDSTADRPTSKISDRHNTTVVKTTVVKTTVKVDPVSPVSPKAAGFPKSPTSPTAASATAASGSDASRSSSSSSLSSASQSHQKTVTYHSQVSNPGITKSSTTVTGLHVTVTPSRHPANELPKTPDESSVPGWKAEIEMRKKTKSHIPTQKPKEPMKMSEVPEWKKQLQEKNKMKKISSSDETDITLARVTTLLLNPSASSMPLKVEMDRLKHEMVINHKGRGDNLPEWARLADEKQKTIIH